MSKNFHFTSIDHILIGYNTINPPSEDEWYNWLILCSALFEEHGLITILIFSEGGGPNAKQRKLSLELFNKDQIKRSPGAIITETTEVYEIVIDYYWKTGETMKIFKKDELEEALLWSNVDLNYKQKILAAVDKLKKEI